MLPNSCPTTQVSEWLCYQFPKPLLDSWLANGKGWGGKYVGQAQRWFFFRFTGEDSEVDLNAHGACLCVAAALRSCVSGSLTLRVLPSLCHSTLPLHPGDPEFCEWKWIPFDERVADQVVAFKRKVYDRVISYGRDVFQLRPTSRNN